MSYGYKSEILVFSGEVFDEIYLQQLRIEGVVHVTATNQIFQ